MGPNGAGKTSTIRWKINFLTQFLEPILYLVAFGLGLGTLVGEIGYAGRTVSYLSFVAPAILAIDMMQNAFFSCFFCCSGRFRSWPCGGVLFDRNRL